jgi:cysteine-rich repeat protein
MKQVKRFALTGAILTTTVGLMGCPDPVETLDTGASVIDTGTTDNDSGTPGRDAGRDTGTAPRDAAMNPDAFAPRCGDGTINGTDVCDDSNTTAGDGCSATCTAEAGFSCNSASPTVCTAVCGDGMRVGAESEANGCDDTNTTAGDGCSATCAVESGFSCTGTPSMCMTGCGDRVVAGSETCDDGNTVDGDGCAMSCASETGYTCTGSPSTCTATCGDGLLAVGRETCDDMNVAAGDGCSAMCATEAGFTCTGTTCTATCGDGMTVGSETCDDMNTVTEACAYGLMSCMVCDATCRTVAGATSFCGNSTTDGAETCDDGNAVTETCMYGAMSCMVCNATCQTAPGATSRCGDSRTDAANGETCDDGNAVTEACMYGLRTCSVCTATCATGAGIATFCGDNVRNGGEVCDDGNNVTETVCPYGSATCTLCNAACAAPLTLRGPSCGDGIINGPEACDDGFANGGDGCSATCTLEAGFVCTGAPSRCSTTVSYSGAPVAVPDRDPAGARLSVTVPTTCAIASVSTTHAWQTPGHSYAGDIIISVVAPTATTVLSNRAGDGSDLFGPYTFARGGAAWPGAGSPIASGSYAATYPAVLGAPANGTWSLLAVDSASGDTGALAAFSVTINCLPSATIVPVTTARTCAEILATAPTAANGTYFIDPDAAGGTIVSARVYCDMTNGGWTLLMASNSLGPDRQTVSATVLPNSGTYLPATFAQALATAGSQVHIRTAGAAATRSITSVANTLPIQNLRAGIVLTANSPFRSTGDSVAALWTGPFAANAQYLWHTCGPAPFGASAIYPAIYHACNNSGGVHILSTNSGWTSTAVENMEVYVR